MLYVVLTAPGNAFLQVWADEAVNLGESWKSHQETSFYSEPDGASIAPPPFDEEALDLIHNYSSFLENCFGFLVAKKPNLDDSLQRTCLMKTEGQEKSYYDDP